MSGRACRCETPSVISNQSRAFVNFGGSRGGRSWHVPSAHNIKRRVTHHNNLVSISGNTVVVGVVWCSHVQLHDMHRSLTALNLRGTHMKLLRGDRGLASIAALIAMAVVLVFGVDAASAARSAAGSSSSSSVVDVAPTPTAGCTVKPTIVLVHGAWANAASWSGEIDRLQRDGYVVRAVANPLRGLTSDAASVADFLATLSGPIVLVGHSYGGAFLPHAPPGDRHGKEVGYCDARPPALGRPILD